ncbi:tryptophan synthase beta subunit-like PLP-dependent enzyme [Pisolithus sp. B1]|nr:tryptophan synthase beta subunit-like PLP-dependent enzyme [Pisolithus sp. B1]
MSSTLTIHHHPYITTGTIKAVFDAKEQRKHDTIPILPKMQAGGDDITKVGIPFSDPVAEGPAIQETNLMICYAALQNRASQRGSKQGPTVLVLLTGYYNPILTYGEDKATQDVHEAGANGFLMVDLPPGEASGFCEKCMNARFLQLHCSTYFLEFIYHSSQMGSTELSVKGFINSELPVIITHVHKHTSMPLAMVFGVAMCLHFDAIVEVRADGVVVRSHIVSLIKEAPLESLTKSHSATGPVSCFYSNHTGSHKINNAVGQHGVATATVCACFRMECIIYMGAEDVRRQALNVFHMKMLGAEVIRCEVKAQMEEAIGKLLDVVIACIGDGSNTIGCFYEFTPDMSVHLMGVEAGGEDPAGQIVEMDTISAGWDYPAIGPEHSWFKDSRQAEYIVAMDEEALRGLHLCTQLKGIITAILIPLLTLRNTVPLWERWQGFRTNL